MDKAFRHNRERRSGGEGEEGTGACEHRGERKGAGGAEREAWDVGLEEGSEGRGFGANQGSDDCCALTLHTSWLRISG